MHTRCVQRVRSERRSFTNCFVFGSTDNQTGSNCCLTSSSKCLNIPFSNVISVISNYSNVTWGKKCDIVLCTRLHCLRSVKQIPINFTIEVCMAFIEFDNGICNSMTSGGFLSNIALTFVWNLGHRYIWRTNNALITYSILLNDPVSLGAASVKALMNPSYQKSEIRRFTSSSLLRSFLRFKFRTLFVCLYRVNMNCSWVPSTTLDDIKPGNSL